MGKLLHLTYSCLALGFALPMQAKVINPQQARAIAAKYVSMAEQPKAFRAPGAKAADTPDFYAFNDSRGRGFVLVAGDDCLKPVLGYSRTGSIDTDNLPPAMKAWLDAVAESIAKARAEGGGIARTADSGDGTDPDAPTEVVEPLVKSKWNQTAPYYNNTPTKNGEQTLTGCVATAMAQVMNYYQWPEHGYGSVSYDTPQYDSKTMSIDFTQSAYDWANMLDEYTYRGAGTGQRPAWNDAQGKAVAQLMADLGAAVHMQYGTNREGGSGAYDFDIATAATYHFGYDVDMQSKNNYTIAQWTKLVEQSLDNGAPLVYCGVSQTDEMSQGAGHCFIVDGYDSDDYVHVNWGWAGAGDGYFDFYNFGTDGYSFTKQMMYARLTPNRSGKVTSAAQAPLCISSNYSKVYQDGKEMKDKLVTADADKLDADLDIMLYYKSWDTFKGNIYLDAVPENGGQAKRLLTVNDAQPVNIKGRLQRFSITGSDIAGLADGRYTLRISSQRTNNAVQGSGTSFDIPVCDAVSDAIYAPMLIKQGGKAKVGLVNTHAPILSQTSELKFERTEYDITDVARFTVSIKNDSDIDSDQPLYLKIVGSDGKAAYQPIANIPLFAGDAGTLSKNVAIFGEGGFTEGTYQVSLVQAQDGQPCPLEGAAATTLKVNRNDSKLPVVELADLQILVNGEPLPSLDNIVVDKADDFLPKGTITCKMPAMTPDTVNIYVEFGVVIDGDNTHQFIDMARVQEKQDVYWNAEPIVMLEDDLVGKTGYIYAMYRPMYSTEMQFLKYNGKDVHIPFKVVDKATAIDNVGDTDKARETMRFDTLGQRIAKPAKGINIVRMSDGTVRKVMVK